MSEHPAPTTRLEFRPFDLENLPDLAALLRDSAVMRFTIQGARTVEQSREVLLGFQRAQAEHGFSKWAVWRRADGAFVGYCGLDLYPIEGRPEVELGYRLMPAFWGQGLATEAGRAVVEWAFGERGLPYVLAFLDPANVASVRVLEKIGLTRRFDTDIKGHRMDVYRIDAPLPRA